MTNTGSWSINNKTVESLYIGNKEIETIERVSDGAIIYQKPVNNDLILTFTGDTFTPYDNTTNKGLIGSNMVIDWGDGTTESLTSNTKLPTHTYQTSDTYTIRIQGEITGIGVYCFRGITGLTSITIPNSVTSLGDNCFSNCTGLTSITIPNNVTSLGDNCFNNCTGLTSITIPNSVTSLGRYCFYRCSSLTSIIIPNSVLGLRDYCFRYCTNLTSITLPDSLTYFGNNTFRDCSSLTSIVIPNSVYNLGTDTFQDCTSLIDYELYWNDPPKTWTNNLMPNNTDTYYTIPHGSTANYVAKSFPSAKLIERNP